jgi:hypothetical protein
MYIKQVVGVLTGLNWIMAGSNGKLQRKQIINRNRFIKYWEFPDHLSDYHILMKDIAQ